MAPSSMAGRRTSSDRVFVRISFVGSGGTIGPTRRLFRIVVRRNGAYDACECARPSRIASIRAVRPNGQSAVLGSAGRSADAAGTLTVRQGRDARIPAGRHHISKRIGRSPSDETRPHRASDPSWTTNASKTITLHPPRMRSHRHGDLAENERHPVGLTAAYRRFGDKIAQA